MLDSNEIKKLAQLIARNIFARGDRCYPPHVVSRIQFMSGEHPNERGLCGLNEVALMNVIEETISSAYGKAGGGASVVD